MMTASYSRNFTAVTVAHIVVVIALVIIPTWRHFFQKDRTVEMEVFTVAIPEDMIDTEQADEPEDDTPSAFIEEKSELADKKRPPPKKPEVKKPTPKKPEVKKPEKPKDVKQKGQKIRLDRPVPVVANPKNRLTADQIRDLMNRGAVAGTETIIPESVMGLNRAVIHNKIYDAWIQPSYEEVGGAVAVVEIRFALDGTILNATIRRSSGNAAMDASALQAVQYVRRIDGLSPAYLKANPTVELAFKVTSDGGL